LIPIDSTGYVINDGFLNVLVSLNYMLVLAGHVVPPFEQNSFKLITDILELVTIEQVIAWLLAYLQVGLVFATWNTLLGNITYILPSLSIGFPRVIEKVTSTFLSRLLTLIYGALAIANGPAYAVNAKS